MKRSLLALGATVVLTVLAGLPAVLALAQPEPTQEAQEPPVEQPEVPESELAVDQPRGRTAGGPAEQVDGRSTDGVAGPRALELYRSQGCGVCHAFAAAGTTGMFGPGHDAMGIIAGARIRDPGYRGKATDAAGYIRESIVAPVAYIVPGYGASYHRMPEYSFLSHEDIEALVELLLAAGQPEGRDDM